MVQVNPGTPQKRGSRYTKRSVDASALKTSGVIDALLFSQEDEGGFEMFLLRVVSCLGGWLYFWGAKLLKCAITEEK